MGNDRLTVALRLQWIDRFAAQLGRHAQCAERQTCNFLLIKLLDGSTLGEHVEVAEGAFVRRVEHQLMPDGEVERQQAQGAAERTRARGETPHILLFDVPERQRCWGAGVKMLPRQPGTRFFQVEHDAQG
ncbi:MAG: hypothetical protein ABIK25_07070 [Pseudomonadota bacterium]